MGPARPLPPRSGEWNDRAEVPGMQQVGELQGAAGRPERRRRMKRPRESVVSFPVSVIVDTREQTPYEFAGLRTDAKDGRRPIRVEVIRRGLASGDYSLAGYEFAIAVERKSLVDLYNTLGQGRVRFEAELARLDELRWAAVVVEAGWDLILGEPPERSRLSPISVHRSVIAWQQRFPRVHWWTCPTRAIAERTTFRILERFLKDSKI